MYESEDPCGSNGGRQTLPHFVRAEQEEDFDEFIAKCKELALYDTGVTAEYGDQLITLSTCEYSRTNGRMVVVAKLLEE